MRRTTITIPADLDRELKAFLAAQATPPTLSSLVQAAIRSYLAERRMAERGAKRPAGPLQITPAERGSDLHDVAAHHDRYFASRT